MEEAPKFIKSGDAAIVSVYGRKDAEIGLNPSSGQACGPEAHVCRDLRRLPPSRPFRRP
jgi:hypothetical protein